MVTYFTEFLVLFHCYCAISVLKLFQNEITFAKKQPKEIQSRVCGRSERMKKIQTIPERRQPGFYRME